MTINGNLGSKPAYPSTFQPVKSPEPWKPINETWNGQATTVRFDVTDEDYVQATWLWDLLGKTPGQQDNFVYNVASHLKNANEVVRKRAYGMFGKVNSGLGTSIEEATERAVKGGA